MEKYRDVVSFVIVRDKKLLCAQRRDDQTFPGYWHLPGGKVEEYETINDAILREAVEEIGCKAFPGENLTTAYCRYSFGNFRVHFIRTHLPEENHPVNMGANAALRWMGLEELHTVNWIDIDFCVARIALLEGERTYMEGQWPVKVASENSQV